MPLFKLIISNVDINNGCLFKNTLLRKHKSMLKVKFKKESKIYRRSYCENKGPVKEEEKDIVMTADVGITELNDTINSNNLIELLKKNQFRFDEILIKKEDKGIDNDKYKIRTTEKKLLSTTEKSTIRVIGQYLFNLGLLESCDALMKESGCSVEDTRAIALREYIVKGYWDESIAILDDMNEVFKSDEQKLELKILLLEEKIKEQIIHGDYCLAFRTLQTEYPSDPRLSKRKIDFVKIMIENKYSDKISCWCDDGYEQYNKNVQEERRELISDIQTLLEPDFLLPPHRLSELLKQSVKNQSEDCMYHIDDNVTSSSINNSLIYNHKCSFDEFPGHIRTVLHHNYNEILAIEFSPCGKYLATTGRTRTSSIYTINDDGSFGGELKLAFPSTIIGGGCLSWSSNSECLAIASLDDDKSGVFVYSAKTGYLLRQIWSLPESNEAFTLVSFFPKDNSSRLAFADLKGHFYVADFELDHNLRYDVIDGFRMRALICLSDDCSVIAADTHNRIRKYTFDISENHSPKGETLMTFDSPIIHMVIDRSEKFLLVTTRTAGHRIINIETRQNVGTYYGAHITNCIITSCYGGPQDEFIASGSEDNKVVIWNRKKAEPLLYLNGHSKMVNSVSWNSVNPYMLASAGDDGTVIIWTPKRMIPLSGEDHIQYMEGTRVPSDKWTKTKKKSIENNGKSKPDYFTSEFYGPEW
uniref:LisH domain-containing protein n=1 Tax=Strongyloides stercoralis TaxID=6248 RepID=A0AAF5DSP5_STRER